MDDSNGKSTRENSRIISKSKKFIKEINIIINDWISQL